MKQLTISQATDLLLAQIIKTEIFDLVQDDIKHCKRCLDIYQDFAKTIISKSKRTSEIVLNFTRLACKYFHISLSFSIQCFLFNYGFRFVSSNTRPCLSPSAYCVLEKYKTAG